MMPQTGSDMWIDAAPVLGAVVGVIAAVLWYVVFVRRVNIGEVVLDWIIDNDRKNRGRGEQ